MSRFIQDFGAKFEDIAAKFERVINRLPDWYSLEDIVVLKFTYQDLILDSFRNLLVHFGLMCYHWFALLQENKRIRGGKS